MEISWKLEKEYEIAREGKLTVGNRIVNTPSILLGLKSKREVEWTIETFNYLDSSQPIKDLFRIGGFVIESQNAPSCLDNHLLAFDKANGNQTDLNGKKITGISEINNFYALLKSKKRFLLIDPNLDRLPYSAYRERFGSDIRGYLPVEIQKILRTQKTEEIGGGKRERVQKALILSQEKKTRDPIKRGESEKPEINPSNEQAFEAGISEIAATLIIKMFELQTKYHASALISPYWPIDLGAFDETMALTMRMYRLSNDLSSKLYGGERPIPVLSLRKNILSDVSPTPRTDPIPPSWKKICSEFCSISPSLLILKITDLNTFDPMSENQYDGLIKFCRFIRKQTKVPILLFGSNEFFYLLIYEGIDMASNHLYHPSYESGFSMTSEDRKNIDLARKYYIPREWGFKKVTELESLDDCPFCEHFSGLVPDDISIGELDSLRFKHMIFNVNEDLEQLVAEMKKGSLRIALLDRCADTGWKKNFTKYLHSPRGSR